MSRNEGVPRTAPTDQGASRATRTNQPLAQHACARHADAATAPVPHLPLARPCRCRQVEWSSGERQYVGHVSAQAGTVAACFLTSRRSHARGAPVRSAGHVTRHTATPTRQWLKSRKNGSKQAICRPHAPTASTMGRQSLHAAMTSGTSWKIDLSRIRHYTNLANDSREWRGDKGVTRRRLTDSGMGCVECERTS